MKFEDFIEWHGLRLIVSAPSGKPNDHIMPGEVFSKDHKRMVVLNSNANFDPVWLGFYNFDPMAQFDEQSNTFIHLPQILSSLKLDTKTCNIPFEDWLDLHKSFKRSPKVIMRRRWTMQRTNRTLLIKGLGQSAFDAFIEDEFAEILQTEIDIEDAKERPNHGKETKALLEKTKKTMTEKTINRETEKTLNTRLKFYLNDIIGSPMEYGTPVELGYTHVIGVDALTKLVEKYPADTWVVDETICDDHTLQPWILCTMPDNAKYALPLQITTTPV